LTETLAAERSRRTGWPTGGPRRPTLGGTRPRWSRPGAPAPRDPWPCRSQGAGFGSGKGRGSPRRWSTESWPARGGSNGPCPRGPDGSAGPIRATPARPQIGPSASAGATAGCSGRSGSTATIGRASGGSSPPGGGPRRPSAPSRNPAGLAGGRGGPLARTPVVRSDHAPIDQGWRFRAAAAPIGGARSSARLPLPSRTPSSRARSRQIRPCGESRSARRASGGGSRDQPPELGWNPSRSADSNRVTSSRGQSMAARKCSAGLHSPSDPVDALETQCRSAGRTTARDEPFAARLRRSGLRSCLGLESGAARCSNPATFRSSSRPGVLRPAPQMPEASLCRRREFSGQGHCQFASTSRAWQRSCSLGQRGAFLIESQGRIDVRTTPGFSGWGATHRRGRHRIHRRARGES